MRSGTDRFQLAVGLLAAIVTAIVPMIFVPYFDDLFKKVKIALPPMSRFFLENYHALWALPVLVVIVWLAWPSPARRGLFACLLGIGSALLILPLLMIAMYWPIFALA